MNSRPAKSTPRVVPQPAKHQTKKVENEKEINLEDFVVIRLGEKPIDDRLKSLNSFTRSFTGSEKCIKYIKSIKTEFIFLIIGRVTLARPLLYLKQECRLVQSIYVLCIRQPELKDQWKEAKIFTDIPSLIKTLEDDIEQTKHDIIKM